jgi:predicted component of type VI protein secretion system
LSAAGALLTVLDRCNGVYLRTRGPAELIDGDLVLVGRQVLRFEIVPGPPTKEKDRQPAVALAGGVVLFGTPSLPAWGRLRQLMATGLARDVLHLSRPDVVLGRESCDLPFADDEFLSRRHARFSFRLGRITLEDLGSSNGTYLRLRGPRPLSSGDMLRLGDQLLRFERG